MEKQVIVQQEMLDNGRQSFSMGREDQLTFRSLISVLKEQTDFLVKEQPADSKVAAALLKKDFDRRIVELRKLAKNAQKKLSNLFSFCDEVFSADSQELLILVTELTINTFCVRFIGRYGCPEYFAHNKALLFYERQQEIIQQIGEIDLSLE